MQQTTWAIPVLLAATTLLRVVSWSSVIICLSVGLHAVVMKEIYARLCHAGRFAWLRLTGIVLILLASHTIQIVMFGVAYHALAGDAHSLTGAYNGSFNDALYFSAAVFSTVGFGDITPAGHLRMMVSIEALAGLVLIAWSASFTFVAMTKLMQPASDDEPQAGD